MNSTNPTPTEELDRILNKHATGMVLSRPIVPGQPLILAVNVGEVKKAIAALITQQTLEARIDELHLEADRFSESGHKGLPPGFQTRMNALQAQLQNINKESKS